MAYLETLGQKQKFLEGSKSRFSR